MIALTITFITLVFLFSCTKQQKEEIARLQQENEALQTRLSAPPAALDSLFPPNAQTPVFLMQ